MAWTARVCAATQDADRRRITVEYVHESGTCVYREQLHFDRDTTAAQIRAEVLERGGRIRDSVLLNLIGLEVTF